MPPKPSNVPFFQTNVKQLNLSTSGTTPGQYGRKNKNTRFPEGKRVFFAVRKMVGAWGFEPQTSCTPSKRATSLRYAPIKVM